jgi:hypothetical protein
VPAGSRDIPVSGSPGLFRRGTEFGARASYRDAFGKRRWVREMLGTTDKTEAKVRRTALEKKLTVDKEGRVVRRNQVTVAAMLMEHWVPYLDIRIALGLFAPSTKGRYLRDLRLKVLPLIGAMPVTEVTVEVAERALATWYLKEGRRRRQGRSPGPRPRSL